MNVNIIQNISYTDISVIYEVCFLCSTKCISANEHLDDGGWISSISRPIACVHATF